MTSLVPIKLNDWQKEISILEKGIQDLTKDKAKVKKLLKKEGVPFAEIPGEKPSVIAQLRKFQEQQERKEQYKQKAKEKHTEQER